jgi:hypothetical protein
VSIDERLADWTPTKLIELIVDRSEAFANQAGVGGRETAGTLVAYLADHPEDIEPWINGGFFELPPSWIEQGRLTYHAQNGKVVHPQDARFSRVVKALGAAA